MGFSFREAKKVEKELLNSSELSESYLRENFFTRLDKQAWYMLSPEIYGECNRAHARFLGRDEEEIKKSPVEEVMQEEYAEKFIADNKYVFASGEDSSVDQVMENARGEERILQIVRRPVFYDNQSGVKAVMGLAEDITDWREAERNLYEKEELFQSIISTLPDLLLVLDDEGKYLKIWTGNRDILFAPRSQLLGQKIDEVLPRDPAEKIMENLDRALESVSMQIFEYSLEVNAGERHFEARIKAAGRDRAVMVARDITDRKRAHNKIKELHNIAVEMGSSQTEEGIYQHTVRAAERILEFDVCSLDIAEDDMLVVKATSSGVPEGGSVSQKIAESGIAGMVYRTGEPHLSDDIQEEPDAAPVDSSYLSALTVPIDDYGVFQAVSSERGKFDREDLQMAELLISHTSTALKRLEAEKEIRYLGFHDELTGLYNRKYIEEELDRLDTPRQLPISVITGDIDSLKLVNDAFGHKKGDSLLQKVGEILQKTCREEDIVGRYGGDEFIIVLPRTDRKDAENIRERIKINCKKAEQNSSIPVSISLGVASKEEAEEEIDEVINRADGDMYENKVRGGDMTRTIIFDNLLERLGSKNYETLQHCRSVMILARKLALELGWQGDRLEKLKEAAYLHDIGMISLDDDILNKKGSLTAGEWKKIKRHPEIGYRIARSSDELAPIAPAILHHHERWDGSGYPRGLSGGDIPLEARIIAITDAFNVMTHKDTYRANISREEAVEELRNCAGGQFDPELVEVFVEEVI